MAGIPHDQVHPDTLAAIAADLAVNCPECGHGTLDHCLIPHPPKPGTLYVGCHAVYRGMNPDDDMQCGCRVSLLCLQGEHDIRKSASKCGACGKELCELCGSDTHSASEGHDLSNPRYWGV